MSRATGNARFTAQGIRTRLPLLAISISLLLTCELSGQLTTFENPPINYHVSPVDDAITRLSARMASGETALEHDALHGYLKSVLKELDVPVSSQMLVFSKTSMQIQRIAPSRPRAIYFNDDVYVAWCQEGDVIEISANDAQQGPTFYTLGQEAKGAPGFIRDQGQCIVCHASGNTQRVPGLFVRSVFAGESGHPNYGSGTYTTDDSSPFKLRWGGWYVTGTHGEMRHMGNRTYTDRERNEDLDSGANRLNLEGLVSTNPYLSPHSDIVALMVLEHQTQMHNAITHANFETRQAIHQSQSMNQALDRDPDFISDSTERRIKSAAKNLVNHLLMHEEFPLSSPVAGTSEFTREFMEQGPRDSRGRSLRDLDLETRLLKYPCSYLIYSPAFDALPDEVRMLAVDELLNILEGKNNSGDFSHISAESRASILEILRETKPALFQAPK